VFDNKEILSNGENRRNLAKWQCRHIGLIADDVSLEENFPQAISWKEAEGETPAVKSGISFNNHIGILHVVLKALAGEVKSLTSRIAALEAG
jgi:hypothetical protein